MDPFFGTYVYSVHSHEAGVSLWVTFSPADGFLLTWGCGRHGKLCQGEENFASEFTPVTVRRLRHIGVVLVSGAALWGVDKRGNVGELNYNRLYVRVLKRGPEEEGGNCETQYCSK